MVAVRLAKIAIVAAAASFCLLAGYNNIVDYGSNYMFVQHVLSMDTTFPDNAVRSSRAILDPQIYRLAYGLIIVAELATGLLCLAGAIRLLMVVKAPASHFNSAKTTAILGLAAAMLFWFFGFIVVGGEWFQMWQSETWNGQDAAFRFSASLGLFLIFLCLEDR